MTAALLNNVELARRLNGNCRVNLNNGNAITLDLIRTDDGYGACAKCSAPCEARHSTGLTGDMCKVRVQNGVVEIEWMCPGCNVTVIEHAGVLQHIATAAEIESDPLCARCRKKD